VLDALRAWQPAIDERHAVAEGHRHLLAKLFQHHAAGEHGADGIAIRTRMRCHQDALRVVKCLDDGADRGRPPLGVRHWREHPVAL
jgi:hypothetical protein